MNEAKTVSVYSWYKSFFPKAGLFITINDGTNQFAIGPKKYARNFCSVLEKHSVACTEDKCPIILLDTLEEAIAFYYGFCLGRKGRVAP